MDAVVVNAAGCCAAMKEYGHLLQADPAYAEKAETMGLLVKDVSEFLVGLGLIARPAPIKTTVTYQDPCHLAHGLGVRSQPRELLSAIPGVELVEMEGSDRCCGSAGIYNFTHPEMAQRLLEEKMTSIAQTGAETVVAPNPGCMLQLRYGSQRHGLKISIDHLVDLLDRAYGGGKRLSDAMNRGPDELASRLESLVGAAAIMSNRHEVTPYAVDGKTPAVVCRPETAESLADALRVCAEIEALVVPWGGGTVMRLGNVPRRVDVVMALGCLSRVVEHDPANLSVTAQAASSFSPSIHLCPGKRRSAAWWPPT